MGFPAISKRSLFSPNRVELPAAVITTDRMIKPPVQFFVHFFQPPRSDR